jgi:iron complex outermembrane receptor protein
MSRSSRILWMGGLVLGAAANAQTPAPGPADRIAEVVVTAQRRSESLQEVPISITALSSATLEQQSINSFADYSSKVPNLAYGHTGDGSGTSRSISIRGISGDDTTGFYIDETPVPDSIDPRVIDIDRIEVLRGPQGSLYGARSMGGTVRVITEQPNFDKSEGRVRAAGGKTANAPDANYGADGAFNVPLIEGKLALRAVGFYQHDVGYLKRRFLTNPADAANLPMNADPTTLGNLSTTTVDNVGRVDSYGGALTLSIKMNDALTITPRLMYQKSDANGFTYTDVGTYPVPGPPSSAPPPVVSMAPGAYTQYRFFNVPEDSKDAWTLASIGLRYDTGIGTFVSSTSYFDRTVDETEDETDFLWQNLLAPFNGVPLSAANPAGPAYAAVPIASSIRELKQIHRFVQEFRFATKFSGHWQYVAGFIFSDTRGRVPWSANYPPALAPGISQTGGFVPGGVVGIPVNPLNPDEIFGQDYQTKVSEPALYGELSYDFNPQWKGTVGLRGYQVKTETGGYLEGIAFGGARITDPSASFTQRGVNPKFGLDYRVSSDVLVFAQIARGFRPSGVMPTIPGNSLSDPLGCFAQLTALGYTSSAQTKNFKSDNLWNYELGAKTAWLDNRVTVDGSAFFIQWNQIQQLVALPCGFQFRANSGAAHVPGVDLELHARPTANLDLTAGVGYQHGRITQVSAAIPSLTVGARLFQVPDWTGDASATYSIPLGNGHTVLGALSYAYTGNSDSATVIATHPRVRPGYNTVDARIAYTFSGYELALVGKNLGNTEANLGDNRSLAAETIGRPRLFVNTPRTVGGEFRMKF